MINDTAQKKNNKDSSTASFLVFYIIIFCSFFLIGFACGKIVTKIRKDSIITEQKKQEEIVKQKIIQKVQMQLTNKLTPTLKKQISQ